MELTKRELLKLNLQHFADEGGSDEGDSGEGETNSAQEADSSNEGEGTGEESGEQPGEKRFTQAELDKIIADRLAREKKKAEDEAERKRLEDEGEYKELLQKAKEDLADKEAEIAARDRKDSINTKLAEKKLSAEDIARYSKYVETLVIGGKEIDDAVEEVYGDFVVAKQSEYGDPSGGFGEGKEAEPKSSTDFGKELFKRVRG